MLVTSPCNHLCGKHAWYFWSFIIHFLSGILSSWLLFFWSTSVYQFINNNILFCAQHWKSWYLLLILYQEISGDIHSTNEGEYTCLRIMLQVLTIKENAWIELKIGSWSAARWIYLKKLIRAEILIHIDTYLDNCHTELFKLVLAPWWPRWWDESIVELGCKAMFTISKTVHWALDEICYFRS